MPIPKRPPTSTYVFEWEGITMTVKSTSEAGGRIKASQSAHFMYGLIVEAHLWTLTDQKVHGWRA